MRLLGADLLWPTLIELEGVGVPAYGVLVMLGFVGAFGLVHHLGRRMGIGLDALVPIYAASAVGGLLGARLLYAVAVDPGALLARGGFAFYGGLLGGAAAVFLVAALRGLPAWKIADLSAPGLLVGLGIGRLGCFFAGCCHGAAAPVGEHARPLLPDGALHGQLWWSTSFPFLASEFHQGLPRLVDVPLYPTQLWSVIAALGLAALLLALWGRRRFDGQIAGLMLLVEPATRFVIEAFRADHRGYLVTWSTPSPGSWPPGFSGAGAELGDPSLVGLTTSQGIALAMLAIGIAVLAYRRGAGVAPEIPLDEEP